MVQEPAVSGTRWRWQLPFLEQGLPFRCNKTFQPNYSKCEIRDPKLQELAVERDCFGFAGRGLVRATGEGRAGGGSGEVKRADPFRRWKSRLAHNNGIPAEVAHGFRQVRGAGERIACRPHGEDD